MPNYKYTCDWCGESEFLNLSMSHDPKATHKCAACLFGNMKRKIISPSTFSIERETLGKWYKDATGNDLLGES